MLTRPIAAVCARQMVGGGRFLDAWSTRKGCGRTRLASAQSPSTVGRMGTLFGLVLGVASPWSQEICRAGSCFPVRMHGGDRVAFTMAAAEAKAWLPAELLACVCACVLM